MVVEEHLAGIMSQATILIDHPEHGFRPGRDLGVLNVKARVADGMQHPSVDDTVVQPFRRCNIIGGELQIGKVQRGCQATAKVSLRVVHGAEKHGVVQQRSNSALQSRHTKSGCRVTC